MKKFIFAACAAMVLFFGSCQKSAKQKFLEKINAATEKVEKAKTPEEASMIAIGFAGELATLAKDDPEMAKLDENDKDIKAAMEKFQDACTKFQAAAPAADELPAEPAADAEEPTADENTAE